MDYAITGEDLVRIERWFTGYTQGFHFDEPEHQNNIHLKVEHTRRVRENVALIAHGEGLGRSAAAMAEAMAILHDVGRFRQYAEHRSFNDSLTVNHGELGAEVLAGSDALDGLPEEEAGMLADAVRHHNAFELPSLENPETLYLLMYLRDADKLDILRVFAELYEGNGGSDTSAVTHCLPDTPTYNNDMLEAVRIGSPASFSYVSNLNDLRLLHLSWIYGLSFAASFRLLLERDLIGRTSAWLPENPDVAKAVTAVKEYAREKRGNV